MWGQGRVRDGRASAPQQHTLRTSPPGPLHLGWTLPRDSTDFCPQCLNASSAVAPKEKGFYFPDTVIAFKMFYFPSKGTTRGCPSRVQTPHAHASPDPTRSRTYSQHPACGGNTERSNRNTRLGDLVPSPLQTTADEVGVPPVTLLQTSPPGASPSQHRGVGEGTALSRTDMGAPPPRPHPTPRRGWRAQCSWG